VFRRNLKTKKSVGANAFDTQIGTVLILLLLKYLQFSFRFGRSHDKLAALLRMNLVTHGDLITRMEVRFA
jgi:hypothetical protein